MTKWRGGHVFLPAALPGPIDNTTMHDVRSGKGAVSVTAVDGWNGNLLRVGSHLKVLEAIDGNKPAFDSNSNIHERGATMSNSPTWKRYLRSFAIAAAFAGGLPGAMSAASAQERLRAVAVFPPSENTTAVYQDFINLVNERGKDVVRIDLVGGPEVIPGNQQVDAVRRGAVDITYSPASYSLGSLPEADALVGATVTPLKARENGGFKILQDAFREKLGVHLLGRLAPAANFHLFLLKEPRRTADGGVDLAGLRIRTSPLFNAFLEDQGAVPLVVPVPDIYTGLERGTFDGLGYSVVSVKGFSWERFLKYRIDPGFFQTDLTIVINPAKWEKLSEEARRIISDVTAEFEQKSYEDFQALSAQIKSELEVDGVQTLTLEGAAADKYLDSAYDSTWNRLKASGSTYYDALRQTLYDR